MVAQAIVTARAAGATGKILVRGDSAYGNRAVVCACVRGKAEFSLVMIKNRAIQRAIAAIDKPAIPGDVPAWPGCVDQLWGEPLYPPVDRDVIHRDAAFGQ